MDEELEIPKYVRVMAAGSQAAYGRGERRDNLDEALLGVLSTAVESGICDIAAVTERHRDQLHTLVATDPLGIQVDDLQYQVDDGPCIQAAYNDGVMISQDLSAEDRWPRWSPAAAVLGVRSAISLHLFTARDAMGAVNLYSRHPRTYTSADLDTAHFIGATASVLLAGYRNADNLWTAIDARHRVGIAEGILMGKYDLSIEQALDVLKRLSVQHELKLGVVAARIITAGELPPDLRL